MNPNEGILMKTSLCYMVKKINVDHISIKGFILPDSFHCFKKICLEPSYTLCRVFRYTVKKGLNPLTTHIHEIQPSIQRELESSLTIVVVKVMGKYLPLLCLFLSFSVFLLLFSFLLLYFLLFLLLHLLPLPFLLLYFPSPLLLLFYEIGSY